MIDYSKFKKSLQQLQRQQLPNSPKPIFRIAADNQLLVNSDAQWLIYAEARVQTAHDYDGLKAASTLALMPGFIADAVALYQTLTGETWA